MRSAALVLGSMVCALGARAEAQPASAPVDEAALEALVDEGTRRAVDKDYAGAIERWKQADRLAPRALHACLIGRAYTRRGLWAQAELFFTACRERATDEQPVPAWADTAERELAEQVAAAGAAPVTFVVEPAGVDVRLQLTGFAPDERFAPRTLHLAPGPHTVTAVADGFAPASRTFEVDGAAARTLTLTLAAPVPEVRETLPPPVRRGRLPWVVIGAGAAVGAAGGIYHATVLRGAWKDLETTRDRGFYDGAGDRAWRSARRNTILLYSAAAATLATGVVLRAMGVGDRREGPSLGVVHVAGGGMITVGWGAP